MKISKKFTFAALAALAVALLSQTAITRAHDQGQRGDRDHRDTADLPIPVAIYDTFKRDPINTTPGFGVTFRGEVTVIIGSDVLTGTSRMDVNVAAGIARCQFTWVIPGAGTLVTSSSVCKLAGGNGIGAWSIEEGTGIFKNFKAVGTETFGPIPPADPAFALGFTDFERFAGIGTFDKHGDD